MKIQSSTNSLLIVSSPAARRAWFSVSALARQSVLSGSSAGSGQIKDALVNSITSATVDNGWTLQVVDGQPDVLANGVSYDSLTPSIATVDASGSVARVADGTAAIIARGFRYTQRLDLAVSRAGGQTTSTFNGWAAGSLAAHLAAQIDNRIAGKAPASARPIFSTLDHVTPNYVRSVACWAADVDLTAIPAWSSLWDSGALTCGLVAPDVAIGAKHTGANVGTQFRFVTAANQIVTATVAQIADVAGTDIRVLRFAVALPSSITPAKVLPATWANYLPSLAGAMAGCVVPSLTTDQEKKALVEDVLLLAGVNYAQPTDPTRLSFYEGTYSGDSGSPNYLLINGTLVMLDTWYTGGNGSPGYGPALHTRVSAVNAALGAAGSAGQLSAVDLSSFPSY